MCHGNDEGCNKKTECKIPFNELLDLSCAALLKGAIPVPGPTMIQARPSGKQTPPFLIHKGAVMPILRVESHVEHSPCRGLCSLVLYLKQSYH